MKKNITVTLKDYSRITGLIEHTGMKAGMPPSIERFYHRLLSSQVVPHQKIGCNVVTMNSRVILKDLASGRQTEVTITFPKDSAPVRQKISVFSETGIALLGREEKDIVSWTIPGGVGLFEVVRITYQPEAAGDLYL